MIRYFSKHTLFVDRVDQFKAYLKVLNGFTK